MHSYKKSHPDINGKTANDSNLHPMGQNSCKFFIKLSTNALKAEVSSNVKVP